jgi:hypothetical protein
MLYSYLSHAYKYLLLTIASPIIPETYMKAFPGSYFSKHLCRQNNSYGNVEQSFLFISLSPLATELNPTLPNVPTQVGPEAHEGLLLHLLD